MAAKSEIELKITEKIGIYQ